MNSPVLRALTSSLTNRPLASSGALAWAIACPSSYRLKRRLVKKTLKRMWTKGVKKFLLFEPQRGEFKKL
jgi:hypothetical protein